MRHVVELKLFLNMAALKALGQVRHRRNAGALNWAAQAEVSCDLILSRNRVNLLCQLPGLLPALQIFECHMLSFLSALFALPSPLLAPCGRSDDIRKRSLHLPEVPEAAHQQNADTDKR